jgi:hypothetical protein
LELLHFRDGVAAVSVFLDYDEVPHPMRTETYSIPRVGNYKMEVIM